MLIRLFSYVVCIVCILLESCSSCPKVISIMITPESSQRVLFGIEKLEEALKETGFRTVVMKKTEISDERPLIVLGNPEKNTAIQTLMKSSLLKIEGKKPGKEGFALYSCKGGITVIAGWDDSGLLYGCLELADRIRKAKKLPENLDVTDSPVFVLRGPCIGMQKTTPTYDGAMYDYPYTPEEFPFFYDKQHWLQYLDFMVEQRMNMLVLWNGHPFASLLKLPEYPDAQEVSDDILTKNIEIFAWLTNEADRRGIWVIQFFYNIHISHRLARKHNISFQHREPTELTVGYTRYCISEFVSSYPNVGLMVCLGEALGGTQNDVEWFTKVIIPGVKDGMKKLDLNEEPPIILRAHSTDPQLVMKSALPIYKNLYTVAKFNGESLTTWQPRGRWRKIHQDLSKLGSVHISNVHLLSNLAPFRYGSPSFIQKCIQASRDMGARGLHLYPLNYWDWPYSPDNTEPRIRQIERDWLWFNTWARYSWNPDRDPLLERTYWTDRLAEQYGSKKAGEKILEAYENSGECAPRILRRFGITGGGRQTMSLGMLMTQLINPERYNPWKDLWESDSPPGERLQEYVEREWKKLPHEGETPVQIIEEILQFSEFAVSAIDTADPHVTKNRNEFARLRNDIYCIDSMTKCYAAKAKAAMLVMRYRYNRDLSDLQKALPLLEESLNEYRKLTELTKKTYLYANSLQCTARKIPFDGKDRKYKHWEECLPEYEKELENFRHNLSELNAKKADDLSQTLEGQKGGLMDWLFE